MIKGILESLANEEEGDGEASQDKKNEPAETPEYVYMFISSLV